MLCDELSILASRKAADCARANGNYGIGLMDRPSNSRHSEFHQWRSPASRFSGLIQKTRAEAERIGAAHMALPAEELRLLTELVQNSGSAREGLWIEVGSLTGGSALALLDGLSPTGRVITIEKNPEREIFLRALFSDPGLEGRIELRVGDSKVMLEKFSAIDGLFLDGAKADYLEHFRWAETNLNSGGLLLVDNIFLKSDLWNGAPADSAKFLSRTRQIEAVRSMLTQIFSSELWSCLVLPTSDGLLVAKKN
jgi:caffeoyl-CoA O-methyltransferase